MHSSIKNFLKYINENENYESIDISDIKLKSSNKLPEVLSITDIENMINFYNHETYLDSRNRTVIDVLYSTGCRVSELCDINISDIDLDEKYLKLKGKGLTRIIKSKVILSPLAGVTDQIFRKLVRKWAPESLLFTEMINATSLKHGYGTQKIKQLE